MKKKRIIFALIIAFSYFLITRILWPIWYQHFAFIPKKKLTVTEKVFIEDLKRKYGFYNAYIIPLTLKNYNLSNNEYEMGARFKNFPILNTKRDSLKKLAFDISKDAFLVIHKKDTTIFKKYKVTFWGKDVLTFDFKAKEFE